MTYTTIDDPKSSVGTFDLVGGFLLEDKEAEQTYRLNRIMLREISGHEEDIIADDSVSFTERLYQVFGRCITQVLDNDGHVITDPKELISVPDGLLFSDIMIILKSLYQVTMGDQLVKKIDCDNPLCKNTQNEVIDLKKLEVYPVKGDPMQRVREYVTSRGTEITWEMLSGKTDRNSNIEDESPKDKVTMTLLRRIRTINGEPATKKALKDLPSRERAEIRKQFDDEGGLETTRKSRCRKCGKSLSYSLTIADFNFFTSPEELED